MASKAHVLTLSVFVVCSVICLATLSCKSGGEGPMPAPEETEATTPEEATTPPSEEVESAPPAEDDSTETGSEETRQPAETTPPQESSEPSGILPTTRRTAAGLPDSLRGYQSWYRLGACSSPPEGTEEAHLPARQTYILLPEGQTTGLGVELATPLPPETILILESKSPSTDYIQKISVMTREADDWKFLRYERSSGDAAFVPAQGGTETCASCHSKGTDSIFAGLKLE